MGRSRVRVGMGCSGPFASVGCLTVLAARAAVAAAAAAAVRRARR